MRRIAQTRYRLLEYLKLGGDILSRIPDGKQKWKLESGISGPSHYTYCQTAESGTDGVGLMPHLIVRAPGDSNTPSGHGPPRAAFSSSLPRKPFPFVTLYFGKRTCPRGHFSIIN